MKSINMWKAFQPRSIAAILICTVAAVGFNAYGGDVVGKLTVGYQAWFACEGDGSQYNDWIHWGDGNGNQPAANDHSFDLYPDVREYTTTFQTGFANLGNGQPAKLFSSYTTQTINKHVEWMQTYGIDTIALQRFGSRINLADVGPMMNDIAVKVKYASQTYSRKFFVMYDISSWTAFQTDIKADWTNTIKGSLNLTGSSAYAKEDGKPIVCIWGIGVSGRPGNDTSWTEVINWFKSQGCYVIVGTQKAWRSLGLNCFDAADMITPWTVGAYRFIAEADIYRNSYMEDDFDECQSNNQDYLPVVWPGFSWVWKEGDLNKIPRLHGDFMWHQLANVRDVCGAGTGAYIAMFDEYDEATAIAKAAANESMTPTDDDFVTMDIDGVACSSDFYLRLAGDGAKMIKGEIGLTWSHPTAHMSGAPIGCTIAIKTTALNGSKYFTADGSYDSNYRLFAKETTIGTDEKFVVIDNGSYISLKALANNKYVCADQQLGSEKPLAANRTSTGNWEKYIWVSNSDGTFSLKSTLNVDYPRWVCADRNLSGDRPVVANRDATTANPGNYEKFTYEIQ